MNVEFLQQWHVWRREDAVGGKRDRIEKFGFSNPRKQGIEVATHEGFSPGEAQLTHTKGRKHRKQFLYFFVGKEFVAFEPFKSGRGHAIVATQIATIGYSQTQVIDGSLVAVFHCSLLLMGNLRVTAPTIAAYCFHLADF
jgi:hypothetical protein